MDEAALPAIGMGAEPLDEAWGVGDAATGCFDAAVVPGVMVLNPWGGVNETRKSGLLQKGQSTCFLGGFVCR